MIYLTIIFVFITLLLLIRILFLKREIRSVSKQLQEVNQHKTEKKIQLVFYDKDVERIAKGINDQIDETKRAVGQKRRTENELKRAISDISHDIRTPMTSILGYVQFLESKDLPPDKRKEYVTIIKKGAQRLKGLLEDFFELSLIESVDYPLNMEWIRLNDYLQEVLIGFYEEFNKRHLNLSLNIYEENIDVFADPSAVKRVLENLIINAIHHSTGDVTIKLEKAPSAVGITVSNPAPQLKEEDLHHLFDRFYKADRSRKGRGTGLGLSIAKSLMQKMNGNLNAELREKQLFMKCEWKSVE